MTAFRWSFLDPCGYAYRLYEFHYIDTLLLALCPSA
jgi:hypothetical protein